MANINDVNTGGNQSAISQIGAEIGKALEGFRQGSSEDISRGTTRATEANGEEVAEEPSSAPATPQTNTQTQPQRRTIPIENSRIFGWADRQRAQDAATMQAQLTEMGKNFNAPSNAVAPSVSKSDYSKAAPMAVDVSSGKVRELKSNDILEDAISDNLDNSSVKPSRQGWRVVGTREKEASKEETIQPAQQGEKKQTTPKKSSQRKKRKITGYVSQIPEIEKKKNETPYEAAERVMNSYEEMRGINARENDQAVYTGYAEYRQNNPLADPSEYISRHNLDNESFRNMAVLPGEDLENDLEEFERMLNETGLRESPEEEELFEEKKILLNKINLSSKL